MKSKILGVLAVVPVAVLALASTGAPAQAAQGSRLDPDIKRVSVGTDGQEGYGDSRGAVLSADGRYVAFGSQASELVPDDTNGRADIFVRDATTNVTERVSVTTGGEQTEGVTGPYGGFSIGISGDGRYVVFTSEASDLVDGDTNGTDDIFVRDRFKGVTTRVSVGTDGTQGNMPSYLPSISSNGRYVLFGSSATNLVPDDTNIPPGNFVRDLRTGVTRRIMRQSGNTMISGDGQKVVFSSSSDSLVPGDTNKTSDVFVYNLTTDKTVRVSVATDGSQGEAGFPLAGSTRASISSDGTKVAFYSDATGLVKDDAPRHSGSTYVRDLTTGVTERVSVTPSGAQGNSSDSANAISPDGRYVAFTSRSSDLVSGDTNKVADAFVRDLRTKVTTRASITSDGTEANSEIQNVKLSRYGQHITFETTAYNLVGDDTNFMVDVFRR